jgi:hypothetical protein
VLVTFIYVVLQSRDVCSLLRTLLGKLVRNSLELSGDKFENSYGNNTWYVDIQMARAYCIWKC